MVEPARSRALRQNLNLRPLDLQHIGVSVVAGQGRERHTWHRSGELGLFSCVHIVRSQTGPGSPALNSHTHGRLLAPPRCATISDMIGLDSRTTRWAARAAAILAGLALLISCGNPGHPCTLMASYTGIRVAIAPKMARTVADSTILICWDDTCRRDVLQLRETPPDPPQAPGNPVFTTETPTAPETLPTNAPRTPEFAGPPGFMVVPDLPQEPVNVTLTFMDKRGSTVLNQSITVIPKPDYPNGRNCSSGGLQASLTVTDDGSLTRR